ncbi:hypothetical protein NB311A_05298 [Nitrobacter sp. Nb-311A]|nr:hypothetical protein NB311A_05298 [Nitrobacter sp. Nb-311A]
MSAQPAAVLHVGAYVAARTTSPTGIDRRRSFHDVIRWFA